HQSLLPIVSHDIHQLLPLNNLDQLRPEAVDTLLREAWSPYRAVLPISALRKTGLQDLGSAVAQALPGEMVQVEVLLPYTENARQAEFHAQGNVEAVDYRADGVAIRGALPRRMLAKFDPFRISAANGTG